MVEPTDDLDVLTRTLFGEARGESAEGQAAVGYVVKNRANWTPSAWWGDTISGVCKKSYQFSSWNVNDPNRSKMLMLSKTDPIYIVLNDIAARVISGEIEDPTQEIGGATQYKVAGTKASWDYAVADLPSKQIGKHVFWRLPPS